MALRSTKTTKPAAKNARSAKPVAKPARAARTPRAAVPVIGKNIQAAIEALVGELNSKQQTALAGFLKTVVKNSHAENMDDIDTKTTTRRKRGEKATEEKPTRRRRAAKTEEAEEKPARRGRAPKPVIEDATVDGIIAFLEELEVEPVVGGVRELKPKVEAWGASYELVVADGETRSEKAELAGTFLAQMEVAKKALTALGDDEIAGLLEDLDIEPAARKSANVAAILSAINELNSNEDEEESEEDEDGEDEDADESDDEEDEEEEEEEEDESEEDEDEDGEDIGDIDDEEEEGDEEEEESDEDPDLDDFDESPKSKRR